jgi:hypothetical protein
LELKPLTTKKGITGIKMPVWDIDKKKSALCLKKVGE